MKTTLKILFGILATSILVLLALSLLVDTNTISSFFGFDITNVVFKREHGSYEFSLVERFPILAFVALCISISSLLIVFKTDAFIRGVGQGFQILGSFVKETFLLIKGSKVKCFLLISFLATIYFAWNYPVTLDEPQSYFYFVHPPFWEALVFYPFPNNHVFSSLVSGIADLIPAIDILFKIRIPALLGSLLTWVLAYRFVRKYYSENLALFVVAIGSVAVTNLQHAYIARGYAYVMLFVVIGLYAAFNIVKEGNRKRDWIIFTLSSALGAFTMPSYLYPFLSLSIFIFIYNYKAIKTQVLFSALVGVLVVIFYSPLLVVTGLDGLTSNEYVESIDRLIVIKSLPGFMLGTMVHIFYLPFYVVLALFGVVGLYTLYKKDKQTLTVWAVFVITPCLFLIIHSVIPFFRTFFYYGFLFIFMIAISFKDEIKRVGEKTLFAVLLFIHLFMLGYFVSASRELMKDVYISHDLRDEILEDGKTYYFDTGISYLEAVNFSFEVQRKNLDVKIEFGGQTNVASLPPYDYYIIKKDGDTSSKNTPSKTMNSVFSVPVNIYKLEDLKKQ